MYEQWKPVLRDVAIWASFAETDTPDETTKIAELKELKQRLEILLIVPEFRKDHVKAALDNQIDDPDVSVQIVAYNEVTDVIKFINPESLSSRKLETQNIKDRTLFVLQTDAEYSAEFAMALATVTNCVAWDESGKRLLTLSSGEIHPTTKTFLELGGGPRLSLFILPGVQKDPTTLRLRPHDNELNIAVNGPCTVLNFSQAPLRDAQQMAIVQSSVNILRMKVPTKLDLDAQIGVRTLTPIQTGGHFFLVLCNQRDRQIFDLRSRQICKVRLLCSKSEMDEQLSWYHRVQVAPGCSSYVIRPAEQPCESAVRRMSICNEQAGGFMAALIEYSERPPGLRLLQSLLHIDDDMDHSRVFCDMSVRLYRQGLTFNPNKPRSRAISPQVHEKAFFKVLRIVKFDYRIAHFLCQKPEDDRVTAGKMLIAAILASDYGFVPKLLHEVNESFVAKLNDFLLRSYFGIWSFTGYIPFKVAIMEAIIDPRRTLTISNWSPTVLEDLGIQVQGHQIIVVQRKCGLLVQALKESEVPINGISEFSTIQPPITPARLREIKLHLARAYLHQMVEISTDEEGLRHAKDRLSGQEFNICEESVNFLAFKEVCQGVYTSLHYSEDGGPRCMGDFTYIGRETLQKLDPEVRDREQLIAKWERSFAFGSNSHEQSDVDICNMILEFRGQLIVGDIEYLGTAKPAKKRALESY